MADPTDDVDTPSELRPSLETFWGHFHKTSCAQSKDCELSLISYDEAWPQLMPI